MYTADQARRSQSENDQRALDDKIIYGTVGKRGKGSIRIEQDDPFRDSIKAELEKRGFANIQITNYDGLSPVGTWEVWFEW